MKVGTGSPWVALVAGRLLAQSAARRNSAPAATSLQLSTLYGPNCKLAASEPHERSAPASALVHPARGDRRLRCRTAGEHQHRRAARLRDPLAGEQPAGEVDDVGRRDRLE